MHTGRLLPLLVATALVSACVPLLPTMPVSKPKAEQREPDLATDLDTDATTPAAYTGQVLGLDGRPAAGVSIKSFIIATGGGNIIAAGGGNIIAAGGGNYRLLSTSEVKTDADGHFSLDLPATAAVNIEAIQADDVKAIQLEVKKEAGPVKLQLAKTGSITGQVTAPDATSVTDFTGVDVFIPGTGYVAKTDAAGSFTIPNVPVGSFALFAMKTGLGTALVQNVRVESEKSTTAPSLPLTVKAPVITALSPLVIGPDREVTITGDHFGATAGKTFQVTVGGTKVTAPVRVDDQTITIKIPTSAGSGDVVVEVDGIPSAGQPIKVLKTLTLTHNLVEVLNDKQYTFTAKGTDTAGVTVDNPPVTWKVVEGDAVEVDASGKLATKALGTAKLTISSGSLTSEPLTVRVVPFLYHVATLAGSGNMGSRDGTGAAADFGMPVQMAMDSQGNLFVLDAASGTPPYRLRKVTPGGVVSTVIATGAGLPNFPGDMTIDGDDNLYISDGGTRKIYRITPAMTVSVYAGSGSTDRFDGALSPEGPATPASFEAPDSLAMDRDGVLHVAEVPSIGQYSALRKLTSPNVTTYSDDVTWTAAVPEPVNITAMTFDQAGNLFWAATANSVTLLYKLTPEGTPSILAGGGAGPTFDGTGGDAVLGQVSGLAVDGQGNVLVSEYHSQLSAAQKAQHLIRMVTPAGVVSTLSGGDYGYQDGRGKAARFETPQDLAVTASGVIYVLDRTNRRVRKLTRAEE